MNAEDGRIPNNRGEGGVVEVVVEQPPRLNQDDDDWLAAMNGNAEEETDYDEDDDEDEEFEMDEEDAARLAAAMFQQPQPPPPPPEAESLEGGPLDPRRMELSEEERQWAWAIKQAIEATPELDNMSDFMYAQYALIDQDNVASALERAEQMQYFRHEYRVIDSLEEGKQYLCGLADLMPGVWLNFSFNHRDGNYVGVVDLTKYYRGEIMTTIEKTRRWLLGVYYIFHVLNPDFESIRRGVVLLYETEGFDLRKHMDVKAFRKVWAELVAVYPTRFQQLKYFHTGVFLNLLMSMARRFIPTHIHSKFQVGCQFDERLDVVYTSPNIEAANQRLHDRCEEALIRRYHHVQSFSLTPRVSDDDVDDDVVASEEVQVPPLPDDAIDGSGLEAPGEKSSSL